MVVTVFLVSLVLSEIFATNNHVTQEMIEMHDDDELYILPEFKSKNDRRVAVPEPPSVPYNKLREPTTEDINTMRIAIASLAAPLDRTRTSKMFKFIYSMCLMFESFRRKTRYQNVDYIIITRNITWAFTDEIRNLVRTCNMTIMQRPLAIKSKYIIDPNFKDVLHDKALAGIGLLDYDFLWPWTFEEYDKVLVIDSDTFFAKNIDHLFTADVDMVFTNGPKSFVNGGMQLIRPSLVKFLDMRRKITAVGAYNKETGWYGHGFIPPDQYGSATLQGFLTYYFTAVNKNVLQVPRDLYNYQFDHLAVASMTDCSKVYMFHFTACPKPISTSLKRFKAIKQHKGKPDICECAFSIYKRFQKKVLSYTKPELRKIVQQYVALAPPDAGIDFS
eukprot:gene6507-7498_t